MQLLEALSKNAATLQTTTIKNFEAEIQKFIKTIETSCAELNKAAADQSKLIAGIAGTVQGVMGQGARDLQSDFNRTHAALQNIIKNAVGQINTDYQENMKRMFQAMADNLAAITQHLMTAGVAVMPAPEAEVKPAKKKKTAAKKEKKSADDVPGDETAKEVA